MRARTASKRVDPLGLFTLTDDDLELVALSSPGQGFPFDRYGRRQRDYDDVDGNTVGLWVRGGIGAGCLDNATFCTTTTGKSRAEMTGQAHAIRKLSKSKHSFGWLHGNFDIADGVNWEVGPGRSWSSRRIDIVDERDDRYDMYEAKVAYGSIEAATIDAENQLLDREENTWVATEREFRLRAATHSETGSYGSTARLTTRVRTTWP